MLKKSLLCSALAIATINPLAVYATEQVDTSANTTTLHPTANQNVVSDTAITDQIKALFSKSPLLSDKNISVTTTNRQVMLTGNLDTDMQYERAISIAESINGVDEVNADKLVVKDSKSPLADTYITAKVKGSLMKERFFGDKEIEYWPVSVETKNGVVYLSGNIDSNEQRTHILNIVKTVKGVKSVESALTVNKGNEQEKADANNANVNTGANADADDNNTDNSKE